MGGAKPEFWAKNKLFEKIFAENYMKMKEIWPGDVRPWCPLPGSANVKVLGSIFTKVFASNG